MYDIITFGSATWDVFIKTKKSQIIKNRKFSTGKGLCFNFGSKIDVDDIDFSSGGGGTNTATTFVKQGLKTAYCGMIGDDLGGEKIIQELKGLGIETRLILKTKIKPTNHSVVLNANGSRTILVYRGASELLRKSDIPWKSLNTKWIYLAPLSGMLADFTDEIVDFAFNKKIKIAFNPGTSQLSLPQKILKDILKKIDVLILNQEEASLLTKINYSKEREIFKKIDEMCPGIAIMTKGEKGVKVSNGRKIYTAKPSKINVVDQTGAGDSFASGFISGLILDKDIRYAIQLGIANANSCLGAWGSKHNLLGKDAKFNKVKIEVK